MIRITSVRGPRIITGLCVLLSVLAASCGPGSSGASGGARAKSGSKAGGADLAAPATWTYPGVRGRVTALPSATGDLKIQHEHIPTFVHPVHGTLVQNPNGSTGMRAMAMPMPPAAGLDVSTLAVGDVVEFTLSVWDAKATGTGTHAWRMTAFTELPGDTALDFADKPASVTPTPPGQPAQP